MFGDRFVAARRKEPRRWIGLVALISGLVHVAGVAALVVVSFWRIEPLQAKHPPILQFPQLAPPPPAAAAPPPPPVAAATRPERTPRPTSELVQPDPSDPPESTGEATGHEQGVDGGQDGGKVGGEVGGHPDGTIGGDIHGIPGGLGDLTPPPAPAPAPPRHVPPQALRALRVAGNERIVPPESVRLVMRTQGIQRLDVALKLCVDARGVPSRVEILQGSGFAEYDARIREELRGWRYRPFTVDGVPTPACTGVTFVYRFE